MSKKYGFNKIKFIEGKPVRTLVTGDGKSEFTNIVHDDGTVAIGFSYGMGQGIGKLRENEEGTPSNEIGVRFQVIFESQASIDSMITTLLRVKNGLR